MADPMTRDAMADWLENEAVRHIYCPHSASYETEVARRICEAAAALRAAPPADAGAPPALVALVREWQEADELLDDASARSMRRWHEALAALKRWTPAPPAAPPACPTCKGTGYVTGYEQIDPGLSYPVAEDCPTCAAPPADAGAPPALVALTPRHDQALHTAIGWMSPEESLADTRQALIEVLMALKPVIFGTPAPPAAPPAVRHGFGCPHDGDDMIGPCAYCCPHGHVASVQPSPCPKCAPPAVQVGEPMPAIEIGDVVEVCGKTLSTVVDVRAVDESGHDETIRVEGWDWTRPSDITTIFAPRWRRREGA